MVQSDTRRRLEVLAELADLGREAGPVERDLVREARDERERALEAALASGENAR